MKFNPYNTRPSRYRQAVNRAAMFWLLVGGFPLIFVIAAKLTDKFVIPIVIFVSILGLYALIHTIANRWK